MKPLGLLFTCLLVAGVSPAQVTSVSQAPPGVVFLKLKWSREIQLPRDWDRAPYDASSTSNDPLSSASRQVERAPGSSSPFPPGGKLPYIYHYSAKIRNDGAKDIKGIIWEYVFNDPGSKKELGRHQFYSYEKISANENATLRARSSSGPSKVVTATGLEKDARSPFDERVEIKCVMYADGSWWIHPTSGQFECLQLKNREKAHKRANRF